MYIVYVTYVSLKWKIYTFCTTSYSVCIIHVYISSLYEVNESTRVQTFEYARLGHVYKFSTCVPPVPTKT